VLDARSPAIVVQKDSPIKAVADLKGKTVAVGKGWNCQYQIVEALEEAGLKFSDIKPAYVTTAADARAAFESRRVDAGYLGSILCGAGVGKRTTGSAGWNRSYSELQADSG
jgi:NitT/TauT family transport system substrate-binding protein/sulfonate transport system substrate-binding protein